jgi:hypothetical protein
MNSAVLILVATLAGLQPQAEKASAAERATAEVEQRFNQAVDKRDDAELERVLANPFTWIHALDGRVESRAMFISNVTKGLGLARQRADSSTTFDRAVAVYDSTAIATSRVRTRFPGGSCEMWLRQSRVYVWSDGAWKLALGHGTPLYDGPVTSATLYEKYAGTYVMADGRTLRMEWDGDSLMATLPLGARTQVFLKSPTTPPPAVSNSGTLATPVGSVAKSVRPTLVTTNERPASRRYLPTTPSSLLTTGPSCNCVC